MLEYKTIWYGSTLVVAPPTEDIVIRTLGTGGPHQGAIKSISMLGSREQLRWSRTEDALTIALPETLPDQPVIGLRIAAHAAGTDALSPQAAE